MSEQITSVSSAPVSLRAFGAKQWVIIAVGLLVIGVTLALGFWQLGRAHEKQAVHEQMTLRAQAAALQVGRDAIDLATDRWRRAHAVGEFAQKLTIYLQNRQQNEQPGFWVMTPLKLARTDRYVMVLRGWIPRNFQAMDLIAPYQTPKGLTQVDGLIAPPPSKLFSFFSDPPAAKIRQNIDLEQFAKFHHIKLYPYILRQSGRMDDGLGRDWPAPNLGIGTNYGYAAQWFGMSATAAIFLLYYLVRHARKKRGNTAR